MERVRCRFVDEVGKIRHERNDMKLIFSIVPRVDDYIRIQNQNYLVVRVSFFFKTTTRIYEPCLDLFLGDDDEH